MKEQPIPYTIKRSNRKTLAVEVTREATVLVRAPLRTAQHTIDAFVLDHAQWIQHKLALSRERLLQHPPLSEEDLSALKEQANAYLPERVAYYSEIMGLYPTGVKITTARTRFGSCSPKNSICFSCLLMRYPKEAIDYVVIHELAHIRHKDHSPAFYETIAQVLPDHKARRKLLR